MSTSINLSSSAALVAIMLVGCAETGGQWAVGSGFLPWLFQAIPFQMMEARAKGQRREQHQGFPRGPPP